MSAGWPRVEAEGRYRPRWAPGVQVLADDGLPHTAILMADLSFVCATDEGTCLLFRSGARIDLPSEGEPRWKLSRLVASCARHMGRAR